MLSNSPRILKSTKIWIVVKIKKILKNNLYNLSNSPNLSTMSKSKRIIFWMLKAAQNAGKQLVLLIQLIHKIRIHKIIQNNVKNKKMLENNSSNSFNLSNLSTISKPKSNILNAESWTKCWRTTRPTRPQNQNLKKIYTKQCEK